MARQAQGRYLESADGKAQLVALDNQAPALQTFTPSNIMPGSVQVSRSSEQEVYTDIYVYYARNPALGGPDDKAAYTSNVSATTTSTTHPTEPLHLLCRFAQTSLDGIVHRLDYLADWIQTEVMAHKLLRFLVIWHTQRRHIVQFSTWLHAINRQLTDALAVQHALVPTRVQGHALEVLRRSDTGPHIALTAQEIDHPHWNFWAEHWETGGQATGTQRWAEHWEDVASILNETWEPPATTSTMILTETWEPPATTSTMILTETWEPPATTSTMILTETWEPL